MILVQLVSLNMKQKVSFSFVTDLASILGGLFVLAVLIDAIVHAILPFNESSKLLI